MRPSIAASIAPTGVLRCGINLSNILLVTGRTDSGVPVGVAPSMAAALAEKLELPLQLVPYKNPGLLADAATKDEWDVGLIGAEPQRATTIAFSQPYCEILATFLVASSSPITSLDQVDAQGNRIAVSRRAAYCLWLENNLEHATLHPTVEPGLDLSRELYEKDGLEALAGLRPWLLEQAETKLKGSRVLDGSFTSVKQALGLPRARADGGASLYLEQFIGEAKASGLVERLMFEHGVQGRLSVAE